MAARTRDISLRGTPPSVEKAMERLLNALRVIKYREDVKKGEQTRVQEAFVLLAGSQQEVTSQATQRQRNYQWLLKKANTAIGPHIVMLCAIGLGQSAIGGMKDHIRADLLEEMIKRRETLECPILCKLAEKYSTTSVPVSGSDTARNASRPTQIHSSATISLTGDVYNLTAEDAYAYDLAHSPIRHRIGTIHYDTYLERNE
ncbi:MAG: hypothetical protein M1814_006886 [Vezdaea aestivalis]|nr:MAG: hypothetical protein M1814_006886 [Vezdaea aestivalis]